MPGQNTPSLPQFHPEFLKGQYTGISVLDSMAVHTINMLFFVLS